MPPVVSSQSPSPEQTMGGSITNRAMTIWNSIPHQVTDKAVESDLKTLDKNMPYGTGGTLKRHTGTQHSTDTYIETRLYGGIIHFVW
jgi:hypothetical protein